MTDEGEKPFTIRDVDARLLHSARLLRHAQQGRMEAPDAIEDAAVLIEKARGILEEIRRRFDELLGA